MSYKCYVEYLYAHGHRWEVDAYQSEYDGMFCVSSEDFVCPECKVKGIQSKSVWSHSVDETNGIEYDEHGVALEYTVPASLEIDHYEERVIKVAIYKVPKA